jgi:hypothetical protein
LRLKIHRRVMPDDVRSDEVGPTESPGEAAGSTRRASARVPSCRSLNRGWTSVPTKVLLGVKREAIETSHIERKHVYSMDEGYMVFIGYSCISWSICSWNGFCPFFEVSMISYSCHTVYWKVKISFG